MDTTNAPEISVSTIREAALAQLDASRADLEALVRIDSVSADSFDQARVAAAADCVADLLRDVGMPEVEILTANRPDGSVGAPAVVARRPAPEGAPTVLLYAHHDVQPPGDPDAWESPAFVPTERNGRLYGRGTGDDKAGVMVHVNTLRTLLPRWSADEGVGITVFVEGEEEIGSPSFVDFLTTYRDKLTADVIVVADSDNWTVDTPALTTSLRGMADITVTVSTLAFGQHSGMNGGAVPDAIMALTKLLSRLWDDQGELVVLDLLRTEAPDLEYSEERLREATGLLDGVHTVGEGSILSRRWTKPAVTIIGMDVPPIAGASNTLHPKASAKLSLRVAPGQDPRSAYQAVREHLMASAPFGAHVDVELSEPGKGFACDTEDPVFKTMMWALSEAWGTKAVTMGMGGSIPFIAELKEAFPEASVLVTGVEDPDTRAHGANESLDLSVFANACVAEALLLETLAQR